MNSLDELEKRLRELSPRQLAPERKNAILREALRRESEKGSSNFVALLFGWIAEMRLPYQVGVGMLATVWILTGYFLLSAPKEAALAIRQFDQAPGISAQEMLVAMESRNQLMRYWEMLFERREEQIRSVEIPSKYHL